MAVAERHCFALDLVDDAALIEEYRRMHKPGAVWPEIIEYIRRQGIVSMQIWHLDDRLFMIVEAEEGYPRIPQGEALHAANERWEKLMSTFQRRLARAATDVKWAPMRCIFDLDEHSV
jgi:L-rhamnose mutarotase